MSINTYSSNFEYQEENWVCKDVFNKKTRIVNGKSLNYLLIYDHVFLDDDNQG